MELVKLLAGRAGTKCTLKAGAMFLRISERLSIDNLNDYPTDVVAQLKELLSKGVAARPDPNRDNFYDVETSGRVFFIHAAPASGKVILLATWMAALPLAELVMATTLAEPSEA
jgi:hypothetical protein